MNNNFEKWIQDSAPSVEVDETNKEIHLALLRHRLRERENRSKIRRKRAGRVGVAALAIVFVFIGGNFSELGSDGFEFVARQNEYLPESTSVEIGFRKLRMTGPPDVSYESLRDLAVEMEAGDGIPKSVVVIGIHGNENWVLEFEYDVGGETHNGARAPILPGRPSKITKDHLDFAINELDEVLKNIENGNLQPVSSRVQTIEGYRFLMKVYHVQSENYGLVLFQQGAPY